ncbi:hypothetical protein KUTeg_002751 [Tegillarca granosa]|uniref:BED-type domain-containing protein n=1 Tax=Tegillarca granosa TaxID=220873 RepID=A0ABQ9FVI9_TEGGR|nr:hypothetical protein KUTeg_002751 [Tegillarca granosa]
MATEQSECRDDVVEITTPLKVKSDVWMHFGHPVYTREGRKITDRDKVICRLCRSSSRYNGNTTNMKTHLLRHHASVYKPQISEKTSVVKVEQQGTSSIDENTVAPPKKPGQINIKDAFGYKFSTCENTYETNWRVHCCRYETIVTC